MAAAPAAEVDRERQIAAIPRRLTTAVGAEMWRARPRLSRPPSPSSARLGGGPRRRCPRMALGARSAVNDAAATDREEGILTTRRVSEGLTTACGGDDKCIYAERCSAGEGKRSITSTASRRETGPLRPRW